MNYPLTTLQSKAKSRLTSHYYQSKLIHEVCDVNNEHLCRRLRFKDLSDGLFFLFSVTSSVLRPSITAVTDVGVPDISRLRASWAAWDQILVSISVTLRQWKWMGPHTHIKEFRVPADSTLCTAQSPHELFATENKCPLKCIETLPFFILF